MRFDPVLADDQRASGGRCCSGRIRLIEVMDRQAFLAGAIAVAAALLAAHAQ